tara:strand:- start:2936 stop:3136 length:201 start_codon:yes stop_codon:yes gene_type:complete
MKVTKANCGASVKAAMGGYMEVGKGYASGGMAQKKQAAKAKEAGTYKKGEVVEASYGGMAKKKKKK